MSRAINNESEARARLGHADAHVYYLSPTIRDTFAIAPVRLNVLFAAVNGESFNEHLKSVSHLFHVHAGRPVRSRAACAERGVRMNYARRVRGSFFYGGKLMPL